MKGVGGGGGDGVDVPGYRSMHEKLLVMMMKNVKASKSANGKRCSESAAVVVVKGRRIASQPGHTHSTLMMIKCAAEARTCCVCVLRGKGRGCLERQPLTHFDGAVIYLFASSFRRFFLFFLFSFARFDYAAETELPNELENEMQSKIYVPH